MRFYVPITKRTPIAHNRQKSEHFVSSLFIFWSRADVAEWIGFAPEAVKDSNLLIACCKSEHLVKPGADHKNISRI